MAVIGSARPVMWFDSTLPTIINNFNSKKMKKLIYRDENVFYYGTEKGIYKISIENDTDCESPREWDNLGTIVAFGRSSHISDPTPHHWFDAEHFQEIYTEKDTIILPLYKYEHGGVAYNTTGFNCRWDSGQIGFIYCSKKKATKEFGKVRCTKKVAQKAIECMQSEVETFSAWVNGQCYGYTVEFCDNEGLLWRVNDCMEEWLRTANTEDTHKFLQNTEKFTWEDVPFQGMDSCWGYIETELEYKKMYCLESALENIE